MAIQGQFIPNHVKVMEALCKAHFTSHQFRFINALIRLTYGYVGNRNNGYRARAKLKYWQGQLDMPKPKICEVISELRTLNVISVDGDMCYKLVMPDNWDAVVFSKRPRLCRIRKEGNGQLCVRKVMNIRKEVNDYSPNGERTDRPIKKTNKENNKEDSPVQKSRGISRQKSYQREAGLFLDMVEKG